MTESERTDATERAEMEEIIGRLLLDQWDPLGVRARPDAARRYAGQAHEIFALIARGASDVQIAERLGDGYTTAEMNAELLEVVRALRALERKKSG